MESPDGVGWIWAILAVKVAPCFSDLMPCAALISQSSELLSLG